MYVCLYHVLVKFLQFSNCARDKVERKEGYDVGKNTERNRHGDFARTSYTCLKKWHPHLAIVINVLADYYCIVYNNAQSDDISEKGHHVYATMRNLSGKNEKPTHIGIAFDSIVPTIRHLSRSLVNLFEQYRKQCKCGAR